MSPFPNVYALEVLAGEVTDLGNSDEAWQTWNYWQTPPPMFQQPASTKPAELELVK